MDNRYIGVFDSGLGGLTCVKELMKELPNENIVYFGDTGRVPYGTRSNEIIIKYVKDDVDFLLKHDIKMIISACGTASSVALDHLPKVSVPIIGVVEPASVAAAKATKTQKIGILGTTATIKQEKYKQALEKINPNFKVFSKACPLFVPLVENGHTESEACKLIVKEYLEEFKNKDIDTIILGCTHYPLLKNVLKEIMGENVTFIDSGAETAKYAKTVLEQNLADKPLPEQYLFYVSDAPENFRTLANLFLKQNREYKVQKVQIGE